MHKYHVLCFCISHKSVNNSLVIVTKILILHCRKGVIYGKIMKFTGGDFLWDDEDISERTVM